MEDRTVEINEAERKKEKKKELKEMRTTSETSVTLSNTQHSNHRDPKEENKKKGHEKILEEIIVESFPKMGKEIATKVREIQRVPDRINPR